MNFLKDSWLHLREFSLTTGAEERIVVRDDKIQVKGNLHRMLPTNFSSWLSGAIVSCANGGTERTNFFLYVGGIKIPLVQSMTLHPNLDIALEEDHDCCISLNARDGKHLMIRLASSSSFQQWHQALCEALAELIFTQAFLFTAAGCLSAQRLEVAMRRAARLVPTANCHWLRAKRLWNIKVELVEILRRLDLDIVSVTRDHVRNFIANSQVDRLIMQDADFVRLQTLEPTLFWSAELIAEDGMQNITLNDPFHRLVHSSSISQTNDLSVSAERLQQLLRSPSSFMPLSLRPAASPMVLSPSASAALPTLGDSLHAMEESDVHWELCSPDRRDANSYSPLLMNSAVHSESPQDAAESNASPSHEEKCSSPATLPSGVEATSPAGCQIEEEEEEEEAKEQGEFLLQLDNLIDRLEEQSPGNSTRERPRMSTSSLSPPLSPVRSPRFSLVARSSSSSAESFDAGHAVCGSFPALEKSPGSTSSRSPPSPIFPSSSFMQSQSASKENLVSNQMSSSAVQDSEWGAWEKDLRTPACQTRTPTVFSPLLTHTLPSPLGGSGGAGGDRDTAEATDLAVLELAEDVMLTASQRKSRRRGERRSISPMRVILQQQQEDEEESASQSKWLPGQGGVRSAVILVVGLLIVLSSLWTAKHSQSLPATIHIVWKSPVGPPPFSPPQPLLQAQDISPSPLPIATPSALSPASAPAKQPPLPSLPDASLPEHFALTESTLSPAPSKNVAMQKVRFTSSLRELIKRSWRKATAWVHNPLQSTWSRLANGLKNAAKGTIRVLTLMPAKHQEVLFDEW